MNDDRLSPCNGHFAVGTVSEESGSVHRANIDLAASAVVDLDLGGVVQQKDLAVCEVLYNEVQPAPSSGLQAQFG